MSITVECPCGQKLNVKDGLAGKKGQCPSCGSIIEIPVQAPGPEDGLLAPADGLAPAGETLAPARAAAYCRTCGGQVLAQAAACPQCGLSPRAGNAHCPSCGARAWPTAAACQKCGAALREPPPAAAFGKAPATPPGAGHPPPASAEPGAAVYAGFWRRFAACLLDSAITGTIGAVAGFATGLVLGIALADKEMDPEEWDTTLEFAGGLVDVLVGWLYYAYMEGSARQATLGKMALGIKVTDLDGGKTSFRQASGRYFCKFLSLFTLGFGYLMVAFTDRKRGLHDIMSGCLVIRGKD